MTSRETIKAEPLKMSQYLDQVDEVFDSENVTKLMDSLEKWTLENFTERDEDERDGSSEGERPSGLRTQRLHLEISENGNSTSEPDEEEEEEEEEDEGPVRTDDDHLSYDQYLQLLHNLSEKSDQAREHKDLLQATLVEFFQDNPEEDGQQDEEVVKWSYEKNLELLAELEEKQAKELEKLKQLSICESSLQKKMEKIREECQSKVASNPKPEQELEEQLNQLCCENIRLQRSIDLLEKKLFGENDWLHELDQKKLARRPGAEDSSELDSKINKGMEALTNIQEKLQWAQEEVQTKQSRLSMLDAEVGRKKDLLVQTNQMVSQLEEANLSMTRYLQLQNWLQQDHKDTVEDCKRLEEKLEDLKRRWIELRGDD